MNALLQLARRGLSERFGRVLLVVWALAALVISGGLASAHWYALPHPAPINPVLVRALAQHTLAADGGKFTVTHVLYAQCRCSQSILEHLIARGARRDVGESSLLVSATPELTARLRGAGYRVEVVPPLELRTRFAIESAPLLIVADPSHAIRYMGGYTLRKQAPDIRDLDIIDAVLAGRIAPELPLFGCAVSQRLQKLLDPLGLRYSANAEENDD